MGLFDNAKKLMETAKKDGLSAALTQAGQMQMEKMGYNLDGTVKEVVVPPNPTRLERLDKFKTLPHALEGEFLELVGKAPFLTKKEIWLEEAKNAPLVYTHIVQANNNLYYPSNETEAAVVLFSPDRATDMDYLKELADKLNEYKNSEAVPPDAAKIVGLLRDSHSGFVEELPRSLTGGAEAYCCVENLAPCEHLPNNFLPDNLILPALLRKKPEVNLCSNLQFISPKFYM
ncbi:MAG: hypothetical protein LBD82_02595 [Deltaproteobacteria bacterium]|jgi:hypothetical protein|nr:hypothetical protein [Deltaproteobacteria bacterium]